jgi:hypothetical protein
VTLPLSETRFPRFVTIFLASVLSSGCAVPASSFLTLGYAKPSTPKPVSPVAIDRVSARNTIFKEETDNPATLVAMRAGRTVDVGPGVDRPDVDVSDPWSIVLTKVHVEDPQKAFFESSTTNIAVLLRVLTNEKNDIDGKWILAYAQAGVEVPSDLSFDNLLVWSGMGSQAVVIDVQLVKLNKASKEQMDGYLSVAGLVAGAIPTYGPIAQALVKAGQAINDARGNYTVLLAYTRGFHPASKLKYAAYGLLPQGLANERAPELWYDLSIPEQIRVMDSRLSANWAVFRIIKGSYKTFEYGRAESLQKVREAADEWITNNNPTASLDQLNKAVQSLVSSTEATRILSRTNFAKQGDIVQALKEVQARRANLTDADYGRILQVVASYLPPDIIPKSDAPINSWIDAATKLNNYNYDRIVDRWVAKK